MLPRFQVSNCIEEPSKNWCSGFLTRNNLKPIVSTEMSSKRILQGSTHVLDEWFKNKYTEDFIKKYNPILIGNLDETMLKAKKRTICIVQKEDRCGIVQGVHEKKLLCQCHTT